MKYSRAGVLTLIASASSCVFAQAANPSLTDVVVTATRSATRADELVSDVTVIDREQIEKAPGLTVSQLLARQPGVEFSSNGGRGKLSSIYIRGTESRHALLLIDGVRYGSATAGTPIWDNIPLESIDRIEILKGPASSLYGSDAVGGVIQIFTKRGTAQGVHPNAFVSAGSDSFYQAGGGVSGGTGPFTYSLNAQRTRDKGFSATNPRVPFGSYNPDRDGFDQTSVDASLGFAINKDWKIDAGGLYADGLNHYDDGLGRDTRARVRSSVSRIGVEGLVLQGWKTSLRYASSADTSNAIDASFLPSNFKTTQDQWTWQNDVSTPVGTVLAGVERLAQRVDSSTAYTVKSRDIDSVFLGLNGSAGPHSWQLNVRRDDNSQYGDANTGFAGYGYALTKALRVFGSYGTTFTAPSFNQLYYPGFSNPALLPERGRDTDLGVSWSQDGQTVKLVHYVNRIHDLIANAPLPVNISRARIEGWTLSYDGSLGPLGVHASYDALDPRNSLTDKLLPRRSRNQVSASVDYTTGPWTAGAAVLHSGDRYDDTANLTRLDGFTTFDLSLAYTINREWKLSTSLTNITDRKYETALGYNQPGRAGLVTLRYTPK